MIYVPVSNTQINEIEEYFLVLRHNHAIHQPANALFEANNNTFIAYWLYMETKDTPSDIEAWEKAKKFYQAEFIDLD